MKRTRINYKGLELEPDQIVLVISEISSILQNEVKHMSEEGSVEVTTKLSFKRPV